jgi:hypothetical protein
MEQNIGVRFNRILDLKYLGEAVSFEDRRF